MICWILRSLLLLLWWWLLLLSLSRWELSILLSIMWPTWYLLWWPLLSRLLLVLSLHGWSSTHLLLLLLLRPSPLTTLNRWPIRLLPLLLLW